MRGATKHVPYCNETRNNICAVDINLFSVILFSYAILEMRNQQFSLCFLLLSLSLLSLVTGDHPTGAAVSSSLCVGVLLQSYDLQDPSPLCITLGGLLGWVPANRILLIHNDDWKTAQTDIRKACDYSVMSTAPWTSRLSDGRAVTPGTSLVDLLPDLPALFRSEPLCDSFLLATSHYGYHRHAARNFPVGAGLLSFTVLTPSLARRYEASQLDGVKHLEPGGRLRIGATIFSRACIADLSYSKQLAPWASSGEEEHLQLGTGQGWPGSCKKVWCRVPLIFLQRPFTRPSESSGELQPRPVQDVVHTCVVVRNYVKYEADQVCPLFLSLQRAIPSLSIWSLYAAEANQTNSHFNSLMSQCPAARPHVKTMAGLTQKSDSDFGYLATNDAVNRLLVGPTSSHMCEYLMITNADNVYGPWLWQSIAPHVEQRVGMIAFDFMSRYLLKWMKVIPHINYIDLGSILFSRECLLKEAPDAFKPLEHKSDQVKLSKYEWDCVRWFCADGWLAQRIYRQRTCTTAIVHEPLLYHQ